MPHGSSTSNATPAVRPYEAPRLDRFGSLRELTLAGGGGNCDPSLVLGPETGQNGANPGRCYE